jgi:hypothetical protein
MKSKTQTDERGEAGLVVRSLSASTLASALLHGNQLFQ